MPNHSAALAIALALVCLTACAPPATAIVTPQRTALAAASATAPPVASATLAPTEASSPAPGATGGTSTGQPVTFTTGDGAMLSGTLYGAGPTAIVFSTMGAQREDTWAPMAQAAAQAGYQALTYNFRFWVSPTTIDGALRAYVAEDLRAAIAFARAQGAEEVILVGASLGGMATAKIAAGEDVAGVVIMAAPPEAPGILTITAVDLARLNVPKLFITSENDAIVAQTESRALFELAPEPKEWQTYPGRAHGTELFAGPLAADVTRRLLDFFAAVASGS